MSPEFLLTALVVCLAPGIGVIYTLSMSLGGGLRQGLFAATGCAIVTSLHLVAALAGLAAILHTSAVLFQAVKLAGVAYLLWMAWTTLRGHGALQVSPDPQALRATPGVVIRRGILLNMLNPKLPIFFVAFLPQFMPADAANPALLLVELGAVFVAMTGAVMIFYALVASAIRVHLVENVRAMTWLRRAFAASFAGLAARLMTERA